MKTATVRKLRHDFGSVLDWVEAGEAVQISKRGKVVAILSPAPARQGRRKPRPDFRARLRRIYGDRLLPGNMVLMEREPTRW